MPRIRLNLHRLTIREKIAKAHQIVAALTGNADFPTPSPPLASITGAANEATTADDDVLAIRQAGKEKTAIRNQKEDTLDQFLTQIAGYVESVAGTNERLILSAGMDMRALGTATTEAPTQPQGLTATAGDRDGEIDLSWDTVTGAKSYVIERSPDPPTTWAHAGVSARSNFTVQNLPSGTRFWFRVAAVNSNGQSGWSDPAMKIAP